MATLSKRMKRTPNSTVTQFELTCRSSTRELLRVEKFLQSMGKRAKLDDGAVYRLLVAGTEAVNNAILHGNGGDEGKQVLIKCSITSRLLRLTVVDEGTGFDADHLDNPLDEKNLMKDHGRGVFLMRSLMNSVRFRKLRAGSAVEMTLELPVSV